MKFFFDNNLSPRYVRMLRGLDVDAVSLREEMPESTKDPELLEALKKKDVVFVTNDRAMQSSPVEAPLLRAANVTTVFIGPFWSKLGFWKQAAWLVTNWESIENFARTFKKGSCAEFSQRGKGTLFKL